MKRINVAEIINGNKYRLLLTLSYNDIMPFIFEYLKKRTLPVILYGILILLSLVPVIFNRLEIAGEYPWYTIVLHSFTGFIILPLVLIIPHELLHVLPYRLSGAKEIRIGARWEESYFFVTAHNHPVNSRWFNAIALTPGVLLTILLLVLLTYLPPLWQWSTSITIFMHLTMCAGDVALLNYIYLNRHRKIITWDDAEKGLAYFYEENNTLSD